MTTSTERNTEQLTENSFDIAEDRACSVKEFANFLGVTTPTVYAESRRGKLTISKVGRHSKILPQHRRSYLNSLSTLHAPLMAEAA